MEFCGFLSGRLGSDNQTRGLILEAEADKKVPVTRNKMLQSVDGKILDRGLFPDAFSFQKAVNDALDTYLKDNPKPNVFVLPFNHGDMENAGKNTDALAGAVKEYYKNNNLGNVTTLVLTSAYFDYKNADIANVPYHLMTKEQANAVENNQTGMKCKVVPTLGVAGNLTKVRINQEANSPKFSEELAQFKNGKPTAFFSLGGRVEGPEIKFTLKDAENLWKRAKEFQEKGFNVAFGNSPRTPTDVTDFLFEKCRENNMAFYNAKKIAQNDNEAADFRMYSGKYKKEFAEQSQKIGNIYPAILAQSSIVIGTMDSFSYTSDTAALGIKTAVYGDMEIDPEKRPDCHRLFNACKNKYVLDLNDDRVFDTAFSMPVLPQTNSTIINAVDKFLNEEKKSRLTTLKETFYQSKKQQTPLVLKSLKSKSR